MGCLKKKLILVLLGVFNVTKKPKPPGFPKPRRFSSIIII